MREGLDEAQRGDGLAGAGRVLEPEALVGVGILGRLVELAVLVVTLVLPVLGLLVVVLRVLGVVILGVLVGALMLGVLVGRLGGRWLGSLGGGRLGSLGGRGVTGVPLDVGEQRGQRARQRVDLVRGQDRPVDEARLLLGQQALETEQQPELAPPGDRGRLAPVSDLGQRGVQRTAPGRPRGHGLFDALAVVDEALAREKFSARDRVRAGKWGGDTHDFWQVWAQDERAAAVRRAARRARHSVGHKGNSSEASPGCAPKDNDYLSRSARPTVWQAVPVRVSIQLTVLAILARCALAGCGGASGTHRCAPGPTATEAASSAVLEP